MTAGPLNPLSGLSALKLALMAKEMREQVQALLHADPIALVGMACRVPGGGTDPQRFWELLRDGRDAVGPIPRERWDSEGWFDPDPSAAGKAVTREAALLDRIDAFDAEYFGILPREAQRMDPQQRLFLEVAIEALDDAGFARERLRGSRTGVYVASYHSDYALLQYGHVGDIDARTLTGTLHSVLTGRLSHLLDLRGPSVSIDTACSSSLVAIHLACEGLRSGETDIAVAGGVSLIVGPELLVSLSKVGFMAPDGRCKTFDASANGFGRGEGCGIVVLKRLADAVADGDRIHAVIRGSAVNQDGHSTLLAAPSGPAQEALIREALGNAQLEPSRIGLVETHGTGTMLGDPIEVEAIATVLGSGAGGALPCWLGAAKANVGHLEAAAGVTGVIKAVLALQHEAIPPQPHFRELSPHIRLDGTRLRVPARLETWARGAVPRCAGVSAFGVSGTNAHVIVEEAPRLPVAEPQPDEPLILPLSAASPAALRDLVSAWVPFLREASAGAADLAFSAAQRRTHYDVRLATVGTTAAQWADSLEGFLRGDASPTLAAGRRPAVAAVRVAFVCSGQGPQWHAMGRDLAASEPTFAAALSECDALLRPLSGWSLLEELARDEPASRLARTDVAQPAIFALQVALARLWDEWGIRADGVVGHSVGEIAALHLAGILSLTEAVRVVWHRGRIMQEATGQGHMASVDLSPEEAAAAIAPHGDLLSLAAINAPRSVVISGASQALDAVLDALASRGVGHRRLPVDYAFHSAQMEPFRSRLERDLGTIEVRVPRLPWYSTVSGAAGTDLRVDAAYVGRNVRECVRLAPAIGAMSADGFDVFLELGPHPVLAASLEETLASRGAEATVATSLRRGRPGRETLLATCARFYAAGVDPDWDALQPGEGPPVSLPPYPWQRKRHWFQSTAMPARTGVPGGHPLLGVVTRAANGLRLHDGGLGESLGWLSDHRLFGHEVMPAAAVIEAFASAAREAGAAAVALGGFTMERPQVLRKGLRWQVAVSAGSEGTSIEWYEVPEGEGAWRRIASARRAAPGARSPALPRLEGAAPMPSDPVYSQFANLGVAFGPAFRVLEELSRGDDAAEAWLQVPPEAESATAGFGLHPVLIDGALQLCSLAAPAGDAGELPARAWLPLGADRIELQFAPGTTRVRARARVREMAASTLTVDVTVENAAGDVLLAFEGLRFVQATAATFARLDEDVLYQVAWESKPASNLGPEAIAAGERWLLVGGDAAWAARLRARLLTTGADCRLLPGVEALAAELEAGPTASRCRVVLLDACTAATFGQDQDAEGEDRRIVEPILAAVQAMAASRAAATLSLVTRGARVARGDEPAAALRPRGAAAWGLAGVVAEEHPEFAVRVLDLDPEQPESEALTACLLVADEPQVALRGGREWMPRLARYRAPADPDAPRRVEVVRAGTLDGVALQAARRATPGPGEVRVEVRAAGLNFRDVLIALDMYPGGPMPLGNECAGVVREVGPGVEGLVVGQRVFGYAPGGLATECVVPAAFLTPTPVGLADDEAAGLPVAYLTAHYGLHHLARLRPGERVLVHAGAGGVGSAAIALALRHGAKVYATAGTEDKRELLLSLGVTRAMDSRNLDFADEVLADTGGAGVDVVLNSLAGDFIEASLRALGRGGRFLELGKRDILTPEQAARERPDIAYHAYDLGAEAHADRALLGPMLRELVAALDAGNLRPLPITRFPIAAAGEAMRYMAQARHVGKIVLVARGGFEISPAASYLVTGGLGGLGLATARWLAEMGARTLVLAGRHAPGAAARAALEALTAQGVEVRVHLADVADREAMGTLLDQIDRSGAPLRGVVHAAGVLRDGVLQKQRWEDCREVLRGKAQGAWVLDELTRGRPLDFFVLYSAAGPLLGAAGQGAYAAANAQLDALAEARRRQGLPALSVAWGLWEGVGMASGTASEAWAARGLRTIEAGMGFDALHRLLREGATHAVVLPIDWARFLDQRAATGADGFFARVATGTTPAPSGARAPAPIAERLRAMPASQRREAFVAELAARALQVLGLESDTPLEPRRPLKEVGLDSLMAVELRNALARSLARPLPATLLFDYPTLDALASHLAGLLQLDLDAPRDAPAPVAAPSFARVQVATLSDEEAEAQLLAELGAPGQSP